MVKKIIIGILLTALSGILIYGAINRSQARSKHVSGEPIARQYSNRNEPRETSKAFEEERAGGGKHWSLGQEAAGQGAQNRVMQASHEVGTAQVAEQVSFQGTVLDISEDAIRVRTDRGDELIVEGMTPRYGLGGGFDIGIGHRVELTGFYDSDEFIVGKLVDLVSGFAIDVREDSGRPLWAGGRSRRGF